MSAPTGARLSDIDLEDYASWQEGTVNRVGDLMANLADAMTYLVLNDANNAQTHVLAALRNASEVRFGVVELGNAMAQWLPRVESDTETCELAMRQDRLVVLTGLRKAS